MNGAVSTKAGRGVIMYDRRFRAGQEPAMAIRSFRPLLLAAALGCIAPPVAASTVYKWTDARGVVNYSTAPPPDAVKPVAIQTTPALDARDLAAAEEARYWRERRQREAIMDLRDLERQRLARDTEELRQLQIRQQMHLASQGVLTDEQRRRMAYEQCMRERRVDCDLAGVTGGYVVPVIARTPRQTITQVAPFPTGTTSPLTGTTAGTQALLAGVRSVGGASSAPARAAARVSR
jgi:hypothetical protein